MREKTLNQYLASVYFKMGIGLFVTTIAAYLTLSLGITSLFQNQLAFLVLGFVQLGLAIGGRSIARKNRGLALLLFSLYAIINGIIFGPILFMSSNLSATILALLSTVLLFGGLTVTGLVIKKDLSTFSQVLGVGTIVLLVVSLINIFLGNSLISILLSALSLLIFGGFVVKDSQQMKNDFHAYGGDVQKGLSLIHAFECYINFVQLFLNLRRFLVRFTE